MMFVEPQQRKDATLALGRDVPVIK